MQQPALFSRIVSRALASYQRLGPSAPGVWRLRRLLSPRLVGQLESGPWIRVSGVSQFEWQVLAGNSGGERATVSKFRELVRPGHVVLDVGSNIGFYALTAGALVGNTGTVIAFEPDPGVAARARENAALNGFGNVTVVTSAVGAIAGTLQLHLGGWDSEGSSLYLEEADTPGALSVPVVSLDDYLREHAISHVDMLKIDAEGAELDVLSGAAELLARADAPTIIVEANPVTLRAASVTMDQLRQALERFGYVVSVIESMPWRGEVVENWLATKSREGA